MQLLVSMSKWMDGWLSPDIGSTDFSGPKKEPLPVDFDTVVVPIIFVSPVQSVSAVVLGSFLCSLPLHNLV